MDVIVGLFNMLVVVFVVSMMLAAGLSTTFTALGQVFRKFWLLILVLLANFVAIPFIGWGVAEMLSLATPAFIAMVLVACSPGGPFGAKMAVIQRGDVVTGGVLQVLLASLGSVTFPFTANWILSAADLGEGVSLPVGKLVMTVVVLQLVPFFVGLAIRNWSPEHAPGWLKASAKTSNITFIAVMVGALLGSWRSIVDLIGSLTLLSAIILGLLAIGAGILLAAGPWKMRTTAGLVASVRNGGPVFVAIGVGFNNDPDILAAATAVFLVMSVIGVLCAAFLARRRPVPEGGQTLADPQP